MNSIEFDFNPVCPNLGPAVYIQGQKDLPPFDYVMSSINSFSFVDVDVETYEFVDAPWVSGAPSSLRNESIVPFHSFPGDAPVFVFNLYDDYHQPLLHTGPHTISFVLSCPDYKNTTTTFSYTNGGILVDTFVPVGPTEHTCVLTISSSFSLVEDVSFPLYLNVCPKNHGMNPKNGECDLCLIVSPLFFNFSFCFFLYLNISTVFFSFRFFLIFRLFFKYLHIYIRFFFVILMCAQRLID